MSTEASRRRGRSAGLGLLRSDPADWMSDEWKDRLWYAFVGFWALYILAPPVMLVFLSFDTAPYVRVPKGITLAKYELMFASQPLIEAVYRSALLGVITMILAPLFALLAVLSYRKTRYKSLFVAALVIPLFVPGVVQGFGLLVFFTQLGFVQPLFAEVIGHLIWAFPFAFLVLLTSMSSVSEDTLMASADLGANEFETFRHVIFPQIKPGLISATIFSFVLSLNEFPRTVYLKGRDNTIPTYVWAKLQVELSPEVFALAGLTVIVSLGLIALGTFYMFRAGQRR